MQCIALAVLGRSTVERQLAFAQERGWHALKFYQTEGDDYALDFGGFDPKDGLEYPVLATFEKVGAGKKLPRLDYCGKVKLRANWLRGERAPAVVPTSLHS